MNFVDKEDDIVGRNNNKPSASFDSIKECDKVEIKKVEKISMVYFYQVTKTNILNDTILFPQTDFDNMYDLDILVTRGRKIIKIYERIKTT
jgi:hypothetical protein